MTVADAVKEILLKAESKLTPAEIVTRIKQSYPQFMPVRLSPERLFARC